MIPMCYQASITQPHIHDNLSHVMKFIWWFHLQKLWRYEIYFKMLILRSPRITNFADIIAVATMFIKKFLKNLKEPLKTERKLKILEIM